MTEPHGGRPLLSVEGLTVTFPAPEGPHAVVRDFALTMGREKIGIVGESGSGKSITARSIPRPRAPSRPGDGAPDGA
jgi:peptide/nickel transport system ATP-binding protein